MKLQKKQLQLANLEAYRMCLKKEQKSCCVKDFQRKAKTLVRLPLNP